MIEVLLEGGAFKYHEPPKYVQSNRVVYPIPFLLIISRVVTGQVETSGQEAAARIKILFRAAETAGVSYAIFWQILNNRETGSPTCLPTRRTNFGLISVIRGYWMYWNSAGKAFIDAMAGR